LDIPQAISSGDTHLLRKLGEVTVLFDLGSWETHLLFPPASTIAEIALEYRLSFGKPPTQEVLQQILVSEYDMNLSLSSELLLQLQVIGITE